MPIICFHDDFKSCWTSLSIAINKYIKHLRVERESWFFFISNIIIEIHFL